ncbi:MAG: tetratricopeptide repeat protein [Acidobacteriota bacterium]
MNRDNFLFLLIGVLGGFLAGYVMHEVMSARQPVPLWAGGTPAAPQGAPQAASQGAPAPTQSGAPAMEMVQRLRARVAADPTDSQAVRQLANMNYDISNWQRAAELYEQFLELVPGEVDVMTDLGACYRNLRNYERALELFREVRKAQPEHWQALYNEVLVLAFDLGDVAGAGEVLDQLSSLQPNNPDVARLAAEVEKRRQGA